jgi:L-lactate dehydrogenase complex protein LldF
MVQLVDMLTDFLGQNETHDLPNASTFCGRCEDVCPVRIPLPKLMRGLRDKQFAEKITPLRTRFGMDFWAFFATKPHLYQYVSSFFIKLLYLFGKKKGRFQVLPLASNWTDSRDFPAPS